MKADSKFFHVADDVGCFEETLSSGYIGTTIAS